MNHPLLASVVAAVLAAVVPAQDPTPAPGSTGAPAAKPDGAAGKSAERGGKWSEGFGRATNYRTAFSTALENAVLKVKGTSIERGPALRSRLSVVTNHSDGDKNGWFDGEGDAEHEWVLQQLSGFVVSYEELKKEKSKDDGQWEVTVKALVADYDPDAASLVVDLVDNDLRQWQMQKVDEENGAVTNSGGDYIGPKIAQYLRDTKLVKIAAKSAGVSTGAQSEKVEREKAGHQLVPSHQVTIAWKPVVVQAKVFRKNKALPSSDRKEAVVGGAVQVSVRIVDLVQNTELVDDSFTVSADQPENRIDPKNTEALHGFVNTLVDKAKAAVAEKIFFALRPPVVTRVWQEGDEWRAEVRMSKRIAAGYRSFQLGSGGALSSPDWQAVATAVLIDGNDTTCQLRLQKVDDPARIVIEHTEVRPLEK